MDTTTWVRRLFQINVMQVVLNGVLALLLLIWFVSADSDAARTTAGPTQLLGEPGLMTGAEPQGQGPPSAPPDEAGPPVETLAAPAGDAPPAEAAPADGLPPPGSGGAGDAAGGVGPAPSNSVGEYLASAEASLKAKAADKGIDVSPYLPTPDEMAAAVRTGDFFNPRTLAVLRKLKKGFETVDATLPTIPDTLPQDGSFP